jgi:preprotein translocase subunit SecG
MNTTPPNTVIVVLLLVSVLAVVAWLMQRQRSLRLKRRFGPEYDLTVSEFHSRKDGDRIDML